MNSKSRYGTGEKAPVKGDYRFDGYTDGLSNPKPTDKEMVITLDKGDTFPPIRSSNKGAYWIKV